MNKPRLSRRFILAYRLGLVSIGASLGWLWFSHKQYAAGSIIIISMAACFIITLTWKRK